MTKEKTIRDGLLNELKDLYSAEEQLLKALPKVADKANNGKLKKAINAHLKETQVQVERLQKISTILGEKLTGKTCKAMQGIIEECKEVLQEDSENKAYIDALLISHSQRVEHYEIAGYGTARAMAEALGEDKIVKLLSETLDEESAADEALSVISEEDILPAACSDEDGSSESFKKPNQAMVRGLVATLIGMSFFISVNFTQAEDLREKQIENERKSRTHELDNTGHNSRDANDYRKTADDQKLGGREIDVLAKIRQEIVANNGLSIYGKNVKVIVENGVVTLRGPVNTQQEKDWIANTSQRVASAYRVDNQLEVAPG